MYTSTVTDELREPTYLLLTALAGGRQHGYAIMQEISALSEGRVVVRAGTLYGALERLLAGGLVRLDGEEVVSGRLRRFYVLTPAGLQVLAEQTARRQASARAAARRLRVLGVQA